MPPSVHSVTQPSQRRATASARQRENRAHHAQNGGHRRRKSRSPDARILDEIPPVLMGTESGSQRRKRKTTSSSTQSLNEYAAQYSGDDIQHERGRRGKAKARAPSSCVEEDTMVLRELSLTSQNTRIKKKERSQSRDTVSLRTRTASPEPTEDVDIGVPSASDGADITRMQREIESLRKQLHSTKKSVQRQSKVIDELRKEVASHHKSQREHTKEIDKWKAQVQKSEELVNSFEQNLSCQICMDLISQPHGLSPCGHVACQSCLQEWFRSAPAGEDEMYDEDEPDALIYRKKTCPCCRTVVASRPIPLFVVKSLTSALEKAKAQPGVPRRTTPPPEEGDPWEGIFADLESYNEFFPMDEDEDEDDDFDEDFDEDDDDWSYDGYGTGEDEEPYHGPYVRPHWEPPSVHATVDDYPFHSVDDDDLRMLRRGATLQMIDMFAMSYTHEHGLYASVDGHNAIFLGWNIFLHPEDENGEGFIDWATADMQRRPERWNVVEERDGSWTAWKLVPEGEEQDYETSDSETWAADLAEDDEF